MRVIAAVLGAIAGIVLWLFLLGVTVRNHGPGLWTLRFERVIVCGLDYNGPPYTDTIRLWLTCGPQHGQAR
jgi:hypothetical protein